MTTDKQKLADAIEQRHGDDHNGNRAYLLTRADRDVILAALRAPSSPDLLPAVPHGNLLPCPFCGKSPKCSTNYRGHPDADMDVAICFECPDGCSVSKDKLSYDEAVIAWNTRTAPEAGEAKPVAWRWSKSGINNGFYYFDDLDGMDERQKQGAEPLYAAPVSADAGLLEENARLLEENEIMATETKYGVIVQNWFDLAKELKVPPNGSVFETVMEMRDKLADAGLGVVTDEMVDRAIEAHEELFDSGDAVGAMRAALASALSQPLNSAPNSLNTTPDLLNSRASGAQRETKTIERCAELCDDMNRPDCAAAIRALAAAPQS